VISQSVSIQGGVDGDREGDGDGNGNGARDGNGNGNDDGGDVEPTARVACGSSQAWARQSDQ
jgi:hypothetical protein